VSEADELLGSLPQGLPANRSSAEAATLIARHAAAMTHDGRQPVIGINGAQGSGKSTLARLAAEALQHLHGLRPALLSLDDFYLTKAARIALARTVHPLCATRGVPGTHDVPLMVRTFGALAAASPRDRTLSPAFDKLADDRLPEDRWPVFTGRPDLVLFEGWCVGLRAEDVPAWKGPINELEAEEDPDGKWFAWSLGALREDYPAVWDRISLLDSIEVPGLETVIASRLKQEQGLPDDSGRPRMDRAQIVRFVQHYERYTRALWAAMPTRADMLFRRDAAFDYTLVES
jgi:D-glycerate 3-kinase